MKNLFILILVLLPAILKSQNVIEWDGKYELQIFDFQSSTTQIGGVNVYSLYTGSGMDFSFYMSNGEFMFTKNFNSKVNCTFKRNAASIVAPDSAFAYDLLNFARYEFDLCELHARKFRKKLYEEKGAFSDASFFKPLYDQIQKEFTERHAKAGKDTDLGRNSERLKVLREEVLIEIQELADFCKTCKPPKKKK